MANDYRIAANFITAAALNASSAYAVESFPRQADMTTALIWYPPTAGSDIYAEGAEQVEALDNTAGWDGGITFEWTLFLPVSGMIEYVEQTLFGGQRSRKFTVQTENRRSRTNHWVVIWCWGVLVPPKDLSPIHRGFSDYKIRFFDGVLAASGSEFTSEFTYEFT